MQRLLVFNAGSSTIKLGVFAREDGHARRIAKGVIDLREAPLVLGFEQGGQREQVALDAPVEDDLHSVIDALLGWLDAHWDDGDVIACGHRIVHGGLEFAAPVQVDDVILAKLDALSPLAPLHQPGGLRLVRAMRALRPELPQVACFDTAFHRSHAEIVTRMGIPRELHDEGVRRYGFHGLSYQSIAETLRLDEPALLAKKLLVAHLGSGASLCAMEGGISRDSSMGFSALDGIPMATRPGALDAGVPLYMQQQRGMGADTLQQWLYHDCGLKGVSGISPDSRDLINSEAQAARDTIDWWCFRISREIAALANTLGGADGIVFTAGVGEHQPLVRAGVVERLSWLGANIDREANTANARGIDAHDSRIALRVIATDEEQVLADAVIPFATH